MPAIQTTLLEVDFPSLVANPQPVLAADNDQPLASSRCLPGLTAAMIDSLLARRFEQGEAALIREFRGRIAAELHPTQRERPNRS